MATSAISFNPTKDQLAVVVKEFTLKKNTDVLQRYNEPYIISMSIDEAGTKNASLNLLPLPFTKVRAGDRVEMEGHGHLVYAPKNPGSFLTYSVLYMESDQQARDIGETIQEIVKSEGKNMGLKELLKEALTYNATLDILTKMTDVVSKVMQKKKDKELFRTVGTLLQGTNPPYHIQQTFVRDNDFIESHIKVVPLNLNKQRNQRILKNFAAPKPSLQFDNMPVTITF